MEGGGEEKVEEEVVFEKGSIVEVEPDDEGFRGSRYVAIVVDTVVLNRSVCVEYNTLLANEDREPLTEVVKIEFLRPLPPSDCGHSFDLHDVVDGFYQDGWWTGVITKVLPKSRFVVSFIDPPDQLELGVSELRLHHDWLDGQWVRAQKLPETNMLEEGGKSRLKKMRGRSPKILAKSPEALVAGEEHNRDVAATDEIVVKDCITSEVKMAPITGVRSARIKGSLRGNDYLKLVGDDKKLPEDPTKQKDSKMKSPLARKDKLSSEKVVQESGGQREKSSSIKNRKRRAGLSIESPQQGIDKLSSEKVVQESGGQREKSSSIKSRKRRAGLNIESPQQEPQEDFRGENAAEDFGTEVVGVEMTMMDKSTSSLDNQPLKMWFGRRHSPTVYGSRVSTAGTVQNTKGNKSIQPPAVDADGSRSWPFARTSPLWENIESMEMFQMMPQKPHFRPLNGFKEGSREGLAIGCMVTFSGVVEKTVNLPFDDPRSRSLIENNLETLVDLESHGFDAKLIRDRLNSLLLLKDKQEKLQDETTKLEAQIMEDTNRNSKNDEDIDEIDREIRGLQERRALHVSMKESMASELASLQSRLEGMGEDIKRVKLDFEGLSSTPWKMA